MHTQMDLGYLQNSIAPKWNIYFSFVIKGHLRFTGVCVYVPWDYLKWLVNGIWNLYILSRTIHLPTGQWTPWKWKTPATWEKHLFLKGWYHCHRAAMLCISVSFLPNGWPIGVRLWDTGLPLCVLVSSSCLDEWMADLFDFGIFLWLRCRNLIPMAVSARMGPGNILFSILRIPVLSPQQRNSICRSSQNPKKSNCGSAPRWLQTWKAGFQSNSCDWSGNCA